MPKKRFVLRIEERTMRAVEKWAADEFRSINGQLEWMIYRSLKQAGRINPPKQHRGKDEQLSPD